MLYYFSTKKVKVETIEERLSSKNREEENFIYETEPVEHQLEEPLTKDEKLELVDRIFEKNTEIEAKENELKAFQQNLKCQIKELENAKASLVHEYKKGKKEITIEAYWRMNYPASGVKSFFRKDTEKLIKSADMSAKDRQLTFEMWQKATGQVVEIENPEEETVEEGNVVPQSNEPEEYDEDDEDDEDDC